MQKSGRRTAAEPEGDGKPGPAVMVGKIRPDGKRESGAAVMLNNVMERSGLTAVKCVQITKYEVGHKNPNLSTMLNTMTRKENVPARRFQGMMFAPSCTNTMRHIGAVRIGVL